MSKLLNWLCPVTSSELGKFLPLFLMKLCLSFNYAILNATKDTVIVTSRGGGAEVIPVLKGGIVIIIAFLVMLLYSKLSNIFSRSKLFYIMILPFLIFFILYGLYLFPNRDVIGLHASADWLSKILGSNHSHWVIVYRYWMNSCFFVLAELWGSLMICVIFWGFVNQITNLKDAVRFYSLFTAGGHIGIILAGIIMYYYSQLMLLDNYEFTIKTLMLLVVLVGIVIILLYWWADQNYKNLNITYKKVNKNKLSLKSSISYIIKSPYLRLIALMVISYGLSVNLVEVTWKAVLQLQYPDPHDYQSYMGMLQLILGIISLVVAVFLSGNITRYYGWYVSAQLTPIILGITSLLFFAIYFLDPNIRFCSPLMLLVFVGTIHNITCKTMKYCLFDTTKEMAYIPLDQESQTKGKAAVDLVGSRFGKSGASWLQLGLMDLIGTGSILSIVPFVSFFVFFIVICWILAVHNLNKRFIKI